MIRPHRRRGFVTNADESRRKDRKSYFLVFLLLSAAAFAVLTMCVKGCAPLPRDGVDGRALAAGVRHELGGEVAEKCPKDKVYDNIRGCTTWKELLGR